MGKTAALGLFSVFALVCLSGPALAQEGQLVEAADDYSHLVLEEIVVTAQKRERNLQETPIAVTALTASYLDNFNIDELSEIGARSPGFSMHQTDRSTTYLSLRGSFASVAAPGFDQPVAVFIDEVYYGRVSELQLDLIDIARVEVLRGPQGTLFGRNVVGGAISIITEEPDEDARGSIKASFGNLNSVNVGAKASGPLGDNVFAGVALKYEDADGWATNAVTGGKQGGVELFSGRGKLRFLPGDSVDVTLTAQYSQDQSGGIPFFAVHGDPQLLPGVIINDDQNYSSSTTQLAVDGGTDRESYGFNANLQWDNDWFGGATLVSVTSWRDSNAVSTDLEEVPFPDPSQFFRFSNDSDVQQFSQELRLEGDSGSLAWTTGLYYLNLDAQRLAWFTANVGLPGSFLDVIPGPPFIPIRFATHQDARVKTKSYAVFGEFTYALNDWSNLTLGGRWTKDKKTGMTAVEGRQPSPFLRFDSVPGYSVPLDDSWDAFTPRIIYDLSFDDVGPFDNIFGYVTIARGFKSGGYNLADNAAGAQTSFDPELSWNYEIGIKTRFWSDRGQLNAALFQVKSKDLQVNQILDAGGIPTTFTSNAGKSKVRGVELEGSLLISENLQANFTYAYTDGKYTEFLSRNANTGQLQDFAGNRLPQTPENTVSFDVEYSVPLAIGELSLLGNLSFRDDVTFNPDAANEERSIFDNTGFINLNLTASYERGPWKVSLWGKNLTDERSLLFVVDALAGAFLTPPEIFSGEDYFTGAISNPRTYGITLSRSWE